MDSIKYKPLTDSELTHKSIFIATPCYGGMVCQEYTQSLLSLLMCCFQSRVNCSFNLASNESLITRGRNHMVSQFMNSGCTHMIFIDADISFQGSDVLKLLRHNLPVVCGAYPLKTDESNYVFNLKDANKLNRFKDTTIFEVLDAGTGFMMIQKHVFEKFGEAHPELLYTPDHIRTANFDGTRKIHAFFDTVIDPKSNRYLSEDYMFCQWARELGIKVWMCPWMRLKHMGSYIFGGDLASLASIGASATADSSQLGKEKPLE